MAEIVESPNYEIVAEHKRNLVDRNSRAALQKGFLNVQQHRIKKIMNNPINVWQPVLQTSLSLERASAAERSSFDLRSAK